MKITLLGTGSPEAYAPRASSGYLIEIAQSKILFDCGGGVFDRLLQYGLLPGDITHVFFTHLHSDHMMDYARLVHAAWDEGAQPLTVHGPAPLQQITDLYFGEQGVFATDLIARTQLPASQEVWASRGGELPRPWPAPIVTEVEPGFSYTHDDGWQITSCFVPHAQPFLTCMAFRLEHAGRVFVYSGDAGICDELDTLASDCDLLLHWCYRASGDNSMPSATELSPDPAQIAQMASRCNAKQLLITHIRKNMDAPEMHGQMRKEMARHYENPADIAHDLMTIEL